MVARPVQLDGALPLRDGVAASRVALPATGWDTVAAFLVDRFPAISPSQWAARMRRGEVLYQDGCAVQPDDRFRPRAMVFYYRSVADEVPIPFEEVVLFQDAHIVVADKPHFLPVTPSGAYLQETLLVRLKRRLGIDQLSPLHRIDRDTAGLVLFCIDPAARGFYQALFRDHAIAKCYEAIAPWRDDLELPLVRRSRLVEGAAFMQMAETSGAPNAETAVSVIERQGNFARYQLQPVTGKKHQLRVHMAALGVPIVNDRLYPVLQPPPPANRPADYLHPLQLLARTLTFRDPLTDAARHFESRLALHF